jgi:hypothetical protein
MFNNCNTDPDHALWVAGGGVGLAKQKHSYEGGLGFLTFPSKYETYKSMKLAVSLGLLSFARNVLGLFYP